MKLLIKVLNESNLYPALSLEGMSGKPYSFGWNKALDCYTYAPKDQTEINDIFATQGVICPWHLAPIIVEGDGQKPGPASIPPYVARNLYEGHADEELKALAADVGLVIQPPETRENMLRQLDAYMLGRAWGAKAPVTQVPPPVPVDTTEIDKLRARVKELEAFPAHLDTEALKRYNDNLSELTVLREKAKAQPATEPTADTAATEKRLAELETQLAAAESKLSKAKKQNGTLRHRLAEETKRRVAIAAGAAVTQADAVPAELPPPIETIDA